MRRPHASILTIFAVALLFSIFCCAGNIENLLRTSPDTRQEPSPLPAESQHLRVVVKRFVEAIHEGNLTSAYSLMDRNFANEFGFDQFKLMVQNDATFRSGPLVYNESVLSSESEGRSEARVKLSFFEHQPFLQLTLDLVKEEGVWKVHHFKEITNN
jgi:hypothetical protein